MRSTWRAALACGWIAAFAVSAHAQRPRGDGEGAWPRPAGSATAVVARADAALTARVTGGAPFLGKAAQASP